MIPVDHNSVMDAASMITAQIENLVSEIRKLRLEICSMGVYIPVIAEHLSTIADNLENPNE